MRPARIRSALAALALIAAAVAPVAAARAVSAAGAAGAAGAGPVRWSHEVPVDEQRLGFEPDVHVGPGDRLYTSVPAGSLFTRSFIWTSADHGNSYYFVPGAITDKPETCVGGGDTELALDPAGNLFFSDLQNLTNLSNSVSTDQGRTFTTNCVGADNTPVDRMWYVVHGTLGQPGFVIYEDYDGVLTGANPSTAPTNQLVEEYSTNGLTFLPVVNTNPAGSGCLGANGVNCVTDNEGISGNQVIAPDGDLLIAHTSADGNQVVVSRGHLASVGGVVTATWTNTVVDASLCPDAVNVVQTCGATTFATIAEDSAGHFYVVFASQPGTTNSSGTFTPSGPYGVYVVSSSDGTHWGRPVLVSTDGGSNAFPWITAGSSGRVAVAWYHANQTGEGGQYTFDSLTHAEFSVAVGESLDASAAHPSYAISTVSEHPIKYGPICTLGLSCTLTGGDRSLGDFLQITHDARGALAVSYVDDTSQAYTPSLVPGGPVYNAGPAVISRQIAGPSLLAGTIDGPAGGPGLAMNQVSEPTGSDFFSGFGQTLPAGPTLDLTGAALTRDAGGGLLARISVKSLASLALPVDIPGTTALWILRWVDYTSGVLGNGHIYYAGMASLAGGAPTFFAGDVTHDPTNQDLYMTFPPTYAIPGSYRPDGTITLHIPAADVGAPRTGQELYTAVAFTAAAPVPLSTTTVFNQLAATTPFDVVLPAAPAPGTATIAGRAGVRGPALAPPPGRSPGGGALAVTGANLLWTGLAGVGLLAAAALVRRRRIFRRLAS
ncbi:MAG: hypothetical protein ACYDAQ_13425 [Mycobacteriales bacterium]